MAERLRLPHPAQMDITGLSPELCRSLYETMLRIRRVEEKIVELYPQQEMRCAVHLSIGQEAVAAGVCATLRRQDYAYSTHRCHHPYLAKGGSVKGLLAELYGRATGCCRGKGGSMHLAFPEVGMMGSSSIVGGTIPVAMGSALAFAMRGEDRVAAAFFGDGAVDEGVFSESLNFASLRKLPVVFVCENNLYAVHSHTSKRQPADNIYERGKPFLVPGVRVDGNDVIAVYRAAQQAVARARSGEGPTLLECRTYRWREHVGPNYDYDLGYRTQKELEEWMGCCPIAAFEQVLLGAGILTPAEKMAIAQRIEQELAEAVSFAQKSPFPAEEELLQHLY